MRVVRRRADVGLGLSFVVLYEFRRRKKSGVGAMRTLVSFAGVFWRGYEKVGWLAWFFAGHNVVVCVANVV
jgi:hypothetical protein